MVLALDLITITRKIGRLSGFEINPEAEIQRVEIRGYQPCLVIDDFLLDVDEAVDFARIHAQEFQMQERGYPGSLFVPAQEKFASVQSFLRTRLSRELGFCRTGINLTSVFSMISKSPKELNWAQRVCHTDPRTEPGHSNLAGLIFLFDDEHLGGTGFYNFRNRRFLEEATKIAEDDMAAALAYLQENIAMYREPARYLTESCEVAELLAVVPPRFNRALFYSGDTPHSANITHPDLLSTEVEQSRLTLNFFASVVPK